MLLLNLSLLIDVTFSTPTGVYTQNRGVSAMAMFRQLTPMFGELSIVSSNCRAKSLVFS